MSLRDYFISTRKLREQLYEAQRDAEVNALSLKSEQEKNEQLFDDLMTAQHSLEEANREMAALEHKNRVLRTAIYMTHPTLETLEGMKQFYEKVAPALDPDCYWLHREAKAITGIDVCSYYPYEDNKGAFAMMKGRQLMRYLEAAYFGAVKWEIVGHTYEKATLLPVDTTTKEYRNYETRLYAKTLDQLGFEVSAPELLDTLKLYSPLTAELEYAADGEDEMEEPYMGQLRGEDLVPYADAITEGIAQEVLPEEAECGLMHYFHGAESIREKVHSIEIQVEAINGTLYGVAVCKTNDTLSPVELEELKDYISGQYSDGWGEGFEQRPRQTSEGELYVHFWQSKGFSLRTEQEMNQLQRNKEQGGLER